MIILKAEHFHIPRSHPSSWFLHRYRVATHLLSILLFVNFIIIIVYSALLGREDVKGIYHAFNIILFVFWGLLFLFMLFTPFWARATHAPTGVFLTFLVSLCPLYKFYVVIEFHLPGFYLDITSDTLLAYSYHLPRIEIPARHVKLGTEQHGCVPRSMVSLFA